MDDNDKTTFTFDEKKLNQAKLLLADFLGVSKDDISLDDYLKEDLHMGATEITDFLEILEENGFPTSGVKLNSIETLQELFEQIIDEDL